MRYESNIKLALASLWVTAILHASGVAATAKGISDTWHIGGDWYSAENARLDTWNEKRLIGDGGEGVLINGRTGKTKSLITKRRDYRDVEIHVEFMMARHANSGIIFHGNYEIQLLDSAHVKEPTGAHCGGVYPRAATQPKYHHIDKGSPPRVNAAKKPGEWQTIDIIFQSPRFDYNGKKTASARFVKVVHNGQVIQENVELPYACGPNWNRKQHPMGPIIIQGDYGPIAIRNVRVRDWDGTGASVAKKLNVPPPDFTALFNGRDFSGFRMSPRAKEMWTIEDGMLKAPKLLEQWGADLVTESTYKDFVLLADFRMPKGSDSGIHFRKFIPDMGYFSQNEQINLGTGQRMGQVESFGYMRHTKMPMVKRLKPNEFPKVKKIAPEPDQWHTIKITMQDRTLSIEVDGETTLDKFSYPAWLLGDEPAPIRFQKHRFTEMAGGKRNPCPIEYRNLFIKEITDAPPAKQGKLNVPPPGFTALFNGKNFAGWHTPPLVREYWKIEDGILKSPGLIQTWGASLSTQKTYRDFILMLDFRMPTISDSGINFRWLIPKIPGFGNMEQFNLRSRGGMGHLESYYFLPKETAEKMGLKEEEKPHVRHIDPEVGVWHTVKLTVQGRTLSAEYDGEVLYDKFQYHDWMLNMEPAPIGLQKHIVVHGDNLGAENACPIEYRNIFIKELAPGAAVEPARGNPPASPNAELLSQIDKNDLPKAYNPAKHQEYVDRRMEKLSGAQRARIGQLWKEKVRIDPNMPNRGQSFVRIMEYVAMDSRKSAASTTPTAPSKSSSPLTGERFKNVSRVAPTPRAADTPPRPNVVMLYADDLGWKDIGCYGGPVKTPALDALAANGMRFTDFHSGCGVCSPSRAVLLTGRHHNRAGVYNVIQERDHRMHLLRREITLAEVLKSNGYATAHFGKWHLGMPVAGRDHPTPADHGFDHWFGLVNGANPSHKNPVNFLRNGKPVGKMAGYSCQIVIDEALAWLDRRRAPDAPFFINVWFNEPHSPIAAPDEIVAKYGPLNNPAAIYSATIENTDRAIARLVDKLKADGTLANTLIVYSSDNGSYRRERNGVLRGDKGSNYEGGHRVPGIFHWPAKIAAGRTVHEPAGVVDLLPTICGLAGIDQPQGVHLDGSDISPILLGQNAKFTRRQPLFWFRPSSNPAMCLREGQYALLAHREHTVPRDMKAMRGIMRQVEDILRKENSPVLADGDMWSQMFNSKFENKEVERLRSKFVQLHRFQESWIPSLKRGGFSRFELYDLANDLSQKSNIAERHPELVARLAKQALEISKSVMAEAPDWGSADKAPTPSSPNPAASKKPNRPNIIVLLADDLGSKDLGCYGGPVKTPALDELAAKGIRFTDFYAGAAVCGPSRAVLLTGRHHARAGIYGNVIFDSIQKPHLLKREVTLPEVLKRYGYATAHFGKWHLGMPTRDVKKPTPAEHGFDYWFGMNSGAHPSHKDPVNFLRNGRPVGKIKGYSCQIVVDEAISWLDKKRDPDAPFFLNLWFHEPHDRVAAPESIVSQYGDLTDLAAVYSATINNTDRAIARLLDKLKEVDSLENTLVFYTSDNGSYRDDRNGNLRGRKGSNFEGGIRVPGIFYWPGTIKGGHVEHEPAGVVDLLPTVCGLLGIDKPEGVHLDGSDLSPLLAGRDSEFARHQPLYWHLPSNNPSVVIRQGNYSMVAYRDYEFPRDRQAIKKVEKEIEEVLRKANSPELVPWVERTDYFYKKFKNKDAERLRGEFMRLNVFQDSWIPVLKSGSYHRFQLFDLVADPTQKVDVSKQHPEVFSRLKRELPKFFNVKLDELNMSAPFHTLEKETRERWIKDRDAVRAYCRSLEIQYFESESDDDDSIFQQILQLFDSENEDDEENEWHEEDDEEDERSQI